MFCQLVRRGSDRVVQSRGSFGVEMREASIQGDEIRSESLIEKSLIRKVHNKCRVLWVRLMQQAHGSSIHRRALVAHRSGIVDKQSQSHRKVLMAKRVYRLRSIVLPYPEVFPSQIFHRT